MGNHRATESTNRLSLDDDQTRQLHEVACRLLTEAADRSTPAIQTSELGRVAEQPVVGVFITLRNQGQLRGCIGNFAAAAPLGKALERAAKGVISHDPRFDPVTPDELPELTVEVSVLHSRTLLGDTPQARAGQVVVGRHGLDIQHRGRSGLLLPRVPVDLGWDAVRFLNEVCRKAGLPETAWQEAEASLFRFEALCFGGPFVVPT